MQKQAAKPIPLITLKAKEKKINLRPTFQRNEVWNKKTKQMLIDSILRDIPIPEVFFKETVDKKYEFEVVDGQQRILTILQFMNSEFKIKKGTIINDTDLSGLFYNQLPQEFKDQIDSYVLNYVAVRGTDEEIEDMFRRFQSGEKIKNVEARNSISGKIRDIKQEILRHPFFQEICGVTGKLNIRMQFDELVEQIFIFEIKGITDVRNADINKLYDEYNNEGIPEDKVKNIYKIFDYLYKGFKEYSQGILKKTAIQGLYLVLMDYIEQDPKQENAEEFAEWYITFENNRVEEDTDDLYQKYNLAMRGGTAKKESLEIRKEVLKELWSKWLD